MQSLLATKLLSILGVRLLFVDLHLVYLTATAHSPVAVLFSEHYSHGQEPWLFLFQRRKPCLILPPNCLKVRIFALDRLIMKKTQRSNPSGRIMPNSCGCMNSSLRGPCR